MRYSSALVRKAFGTGQTLKASFTVGRLICAGSREHRASFCPTRLHAFVDCCVLSARRSLSSVSAVQTRTASSAANEALDMSKTRNLADYVCSSPVAKSCGVKSTDDPDQVAHWEKLGAIMSERLGHPTGNDTNDQQRARVYQYYLPIYLWLRTHLQQHRQSHPDTPLVLGISAPQGSGKTTICDELQHLLSYEGFQAVFASLDDFYLTFDAQQALAKAHPDNPLLQVRGQAGTHDIELARQTLEQLKSATSESSEVAVVRYDKSAHEGRGDRAPPSKWQQVKGKVDVVLFEGWMLGFKPLTDQAAEKAGKDIVEINNYLKKYPAAIDNFVDLWMVVKVGDPKYVYEWRLEAEHNSKAAGKPGMTDEQVADFVDRYMPGYVHYLPELYSRGPTTKQPGKVLTIEIEKSRQLTKEQPEQFVES